jgi:hypothetical protein
MGNTCASVHVLWRGDVADAAKAISRAFAKLGYERTKTAPAEGAKHVIVFARPGERYVSIYDSANADIDSGELKAAALAASKALKSAAVFTSLYDSDRYEFVIFNNGRQVDYLMSDADTYDRPLKRVSDKSRAAQWTKVFTRPVTSEQIAQAASRGGAFAETALAELAELVELAADRPQKHYRDFAAEPEHVAAAFHLRKAATTPVVESGRVSVRNYYDPDNSRKLLVYPAGWPMPLDDEGLLTWLMISEGAGFTSTSVTVEVSGPEGLTIAKGIANGANFHHGQIVGGYELAKGATAEAAQAYLDSKRFLLTPVEPTTGEWRRYHAECPNLRVPAMTPDRTTQILVILQLHLVAAREGEWEVKVTLRPWSEENAAHPLPRARVAAVNVRWLPVVSGLNPRAPYDTADIAEDPPPDAALDFLISQLRDPRRSALPRDQARAELRGEQTRGRERNHKLWLQDLGYSQSRARKERGLEHPAIASNVAILRDEGQATIDACRSFLEDWLRPVATRKGEVRVHAERQMSEAFNVGKTKKTWSTAAFLDDKAYGKLFDAANEYQSIRVDFVPEGGEFPIAGIGLSLSLRQRRGASSRDSDAERARSDFDQAMMASTLAKMRGRKVGDVTVGPTCHAFNWVIAHDACYRALDTSADAMQAKLDAFAAGRPPLQAWHGQATWIPKFDLAGGYESTIYEDVSVLNFFRGVLVEQAFGLKEWRMSAQWCGNVLRMVTPHIWLCRDLIDQVDKAALERVADVSEINGSYRIAKRLGCTLDDLELALLEILPIESVRIKRPRGT